MDAYSSKIIKLAQYLTNLTAHQDVWSEAGKALVNFFGIDLFAVGQRSATGEIVVSHWNLTRSRSFDALFSAIGQPAQTCNTQGNTALEIQESIVETLETGFLSSQVFLSPEPVSIAFLPITKESQVIAVMMVGYQTSEPFSNELLNIYLAVAGLVATTSTRIASEQELWGHRQHLEELVKQRTEALMASNRKLSQEILERQRNEAIMAARLRLISFAQTHTLADLLRATLDEGEALTGSCIGFYHFLDADQTTLSLQNWSSNTVRNMCSAEGAGQHYAVDQAGVWVDCIHQRRAIIHNDYASLTHRKGMPPGHAEVVRQMVVPVMRGDLIVAILGVGNKPSPYDENDISAISSLADLAWDIVENKRAVEALRESEERLLNVIDNNLDGMVVVDERGLVRFCNPAASALLKKNNADLIGLPFGLPVKTNESTEINLLQVSGEVCTVEMRASAFQWATSPAFLVSMRDTTERKRLEDELQRLATTDELTGITNRRHFLTLASNELKRSVRLEKMMAIAIIDIDCFKEINDRHGHASGDQALLALRKICQKNIREIDVFARFGGDEFVLLLPETNCKQAFTIVERVRQSLSSLPIKLDGCEPVPLTISVGIACSVGKQASLDAILECADKALYRAKETGRNRVVVEWGCGKAKQRHPPN